MLKDSKAKELQKGDDVLVRGKITEFAHGGIQIELAGVPGRVYWFESVHVEKVDPPPVVEGAKAEGFEEAVAFVESHGSPKAAAEAYVHEHGIATILADKAKVAAQPVPGAPVTNAANTI